MFIMLVGFHPFDLEGDNSDADILGRVASIEARSRALFSWELVLCARNCKHFQHDCRRTQISCIVCYERDGLRRLTIVSWFCWLVPLPLISLLLIVEEDLFASKYSLCFYKSHLSNDLNAERTVSPWSMTERYRGFAGNILYYTPRRAVFSQSGCLEKPRALVAFNVIPLETVRRGASIHVPTRQHSDKQAWLLRQDLGCQAFQRPGFMCQVFVGIGANKELKCVANQCMSPVRDAILFETWLKIFTCNFCR